MGIEDQDRIVNTFSIVSLDIWSKPSGKRTLKDSVKMKRRISIMKKVWKQDI